LLNKKTGVEYWEHFPLDSVQSIRRWQQDCATGRRHSPAAVAAAHLVQGPGRMSPVDLASRQQQPNDLEANLASRRQMERRTASAGPVSGRHDFDIPLKTQTWSSLYECPPVAGEVPHSATVNDHHSASQWNLQVYNDTTQHLQQINSEVNPPSSQFQQQSLGSSFFTADAQKHFFW